MDKIISLPSVGECGKCVCAHISMSQSVITTDTEFWRVLTSKRSCVCAWGGCWSTECQFVCVFVCLQALPGQPWQRKDVNRDRQAAISLSCLAITHTHTHTAWVIDWRSQTHRNAELQTITSVLAPHSAECSHQQEENVHWQRKRKNLCWLSGTKIIVIRMYCERPCDIYKIHGRERRGEERTFINHYCSLKSQFKQTISFVLNWNCKAWNTPGYFQIDKCVRRQRNKSLAAFYDSMFI